MNDQEHLSEEARGGYALRVVLNCILEGRHESAYWAAKLTYEHTRNGFRVPEHVMDTLKDVITHYDARTGPFVDMKDPQQ